MLHYCLARLQSLKNYLKAPELSPLESAASRPQKAQPDHVDTSSGSALANDESLFRFEGARFVVNEEYEMSQRYVPFNVANLGRVAADAVQARACVAFKKIFDGMYNKVFLLTMDDEVQVIAKIPNRTAGPPHLTIASEVATMEFVSCDQPIFEV